MGSTQETPVVIVGAGPVGLALALELGRRGVRSTVVERSPAPDAGTTTVTAKASVINERSMEFCRMLGIADEVANAGYPDDLSGDTVFCTALNGHYIGRVEMPSAQDRPLPAQCCEKLRRCPQLLFDPILERAVRRQAMARLRYGVEAISCTQDAEGVTVPLRHADGAQETIRATYVVGCDGPASAIRTALAIPFEGRSLGYAISAIVRIHDLGALQRFGRPAERYLFLGADAATWGNFTAIDGRSLWRFSIPGGATKTDLATLDVPARIRAALGRADVPFEVLSVGQWRRSQSTAAHLAHGRVFLAGDAAHTMSPTGGHGLNTGLGDVLTLGWMLQAQLQGWGGPRLAAAYSAERRPVALRNGAGSTRNFGLWTGAHTNSDLLLDSGKGADEQRASLGAQMAQNMRQEFQSLGLALGFTYENSPLIVPDGSPPPFHTPEIYVRSARPGHLAPHVWLDDGRSTIDLFGGGFALLSLSDGAAQQVPWSEDDVQGLIDAAGEAGLPLQCIRLNELEVLERYQQRLVLVRPDGIVAWRANELPEDVGRLVDRVRGMLPPGEDKTVKGVK